jgi:hypothetical protein
MPSNCYRSDSGRYAVRHAPAPYFIPTGIRCSTWDIPYSSTSPNYSANFTFVTPNLCNDMHDCSVSTGDRWLQAQLPKLLATTDYKAGNTAVFITFDEGGGGNETLFTLVLSQYTRAGKVVSTSFNHYSLLRTTEELLKLPLLGNARYASSMRAGFGL